MLRNLPRAALPPMRYHSIRRWTRSPEFFSGARIRCSVSWAARWAMAIAASRFSPNWVSRPAKIGLKAWAKSEREKSITAMRRVSSDRVSSPRANSAWETRGETGSWPTFLSQGRSLGLAKIFLTLSRYAAWLSREMQGPRPGSWWVLSR